MSIVYSYSGPCSDQEYDSDNSEFLTNCREQFSLNFDQAINASPKKCLEDSLFSHHVSVGDYKSKSGRVNDIKFKDHEYEEWESPKLVNKYSSVVYPGRKIDKKVSIEPLSSVISNYHHQIKQEDRLQNKCEIVKSVSNSQKENRQIEHLRYNVKDTRNTDNRIFNCKIDSTTELCNGRTNCCTPTFDRYPVLELSDKNLQKPNGKAFPFYEDDTTDLEVGNESPLSATSSVTNNTYGYPDDITTAQNRSGALLRKKSSLFDLNRNKCLYDNKEDANSKDDKERIIAEFGGHRFGFKKMFYRT